MINNDPIFQEQYPWIKNSSSKATQAAIMYAETAFKNFFKHKTGFPKFKKKKDNRVKVHLPKNNKTDLLVERHRIKVPTIGWIKLKEYGYIPTKNCTVKSCTISKKADRYFISVLIDIYTSTHTNTNNEGIGIDLGVKNLAICSDGNVYKNINKSHRVLRLKKKLKRTQRRLSRKILFRRKKLRGGELPVTKHSANIDKNILQLQKIYIRLTNIRTDYINKVVSEIVKREPSFITIEDLNIKGMMKNKHLAAAVQEQCLFTFLIKLLNKCRQYNIELRRVSKWYPSSKLCSQCGCKKDDLKLKDRIYKCECGLVIDRDVNASINLCNASKYTVLN